jgi:hypothetical protein
MKTMVTERKAKQEGDKAVARKAGKCECLDPTCARTILAGETYFIGPQKDYSHGPYAYNRINRHCPTAVKYIMAKQSMEVTYNENHEEGRQEAATRPCWSVLS